MKSKSIDFQRNAIKDNAFERKEKKRDAAEFLFFCVEVSDE